MLKREGERACVRERERERCHPQQRIFLLSTTPRVFTGYSAYVCIRSYVCWSERERTWENSKAFYLHFTFPFPFNSSMHFIAGVLYKKQQYHVVWMPSIRRGQIGAVHRWCMDLWWCGVVVSFSHLTINFLGDTRDRGTGHSWAQCCNTTNVVQWIFRCLTTNLSPEFLCIAL